MAKQFIRTIDNKDYSEKEIHINNISGVDDWKLASGCDNSDFKTITYVQSLFSTNDGNPYYSLGNTGIKFIIHGASTENVTITQQNVTLIACHPSPDGITLFGDITINSVGGVRLVGLKPNNLIISGSGNTIIEKCQIPSSGVFTKNGSGYVEFNDNCDFFGSVANITGVGAVVFELSKTPTITLNNANAALTVRDCMNGGTINVTNGVLLNINSIQTSPTTTAATITTSATSVAYLINCSPSKSDNTVGKITIAGAHSIINTTYDTVNSSITGLNLGLKSGFDNIILRSVSTTTGKTKGLVLGANGEIMEQVLPSGSGGGTTLPADSSGFLKNNGTGTLSWSGITNTDLPLSGVTAGTYTNPSITYNDKGIATSVVSGSNTPSGAAGGALSGTYPNPTLKDTGVVPNTYNNLLIGADGLIYGARALNDSDIVNHSTDKLTSGTLPIARGGTNNTTIAGNNQIAYSDGTKLNYLSPPNNPGETLIVGGTVGNLSLNWGTLGGASSVDLNNLYIASNTGDDIEGTGSLLNPYLTVDKAKLTGTGNLILMPSFSSYGTIDLTGSGVNGLLAQISAPATSVVSGQVITVGADFNMRGIMSQSLWFEGSYGGANVQDVLLFPNANSYGLVIKANLLASQPNKEYRFTNVDFNYGNQANVSPIVLFPAAFPCTLYIDNCRNVRFSSSTVGGVATADFIPTNWTIKYANCTPVRPSNATGANYINVNTQDELLEDLETGTRFNGTNQIVKTETNGKIPNSVLNIGSATQLKADLTSPQNITTVNTNVICNTGSVTGTGISYNSATGAIVLEPGSTYRLIGNLSFNSNTTAIDGGFVFWNNNTSTPIGTSSISLVGINYNSTLTSSNQIIETITPSVQTTVFLRCNYKGTGTIQLGANNCWIYVERISAIVPPANSLARSSLCMMASVQQTAITTGGAVQFAKTMGTPTGSDITYNPSLNTFYLKAGKAYRIDVEVPWGFGGYANFALFGKRFDTGVNGYIEGAGSSGVDVTNSGAYFGSTPITYETPILTEDWNFRVIVSNTNASGTLYINDPSVEIKARILIHSVTGQVEVLPIMPANPTGIACFSVSAPTTVSAGNAVIFGTTRSNSISNFITYNNTNGEILLKCNADSSLAVYKLEFDLGVVSSNGSPMFVNYAFHDTSNNPILVSRGGRTASPTITDNAGENNVKASYIVEVSTTLTTVPKIISASNANQYSANLIYSFGELGRGVLTIEKLK